MIKRNVGAANGRAKLDDKKVLDIRYRFWVLGQSQKRLARAFGVSQQSISFIVQGKSWKHVRNYKPENE